MSNWTTMNTSKLISVCIIIIKVIKVSANKFLSNFCNSISIVTIQHRKKFRNRVILEIFRWSGTMPWWSDELIIDVTVAVAAKKLASSLRILWEIPSGPTYNYLFNLTLLSSERTSSISTVYWDGTGDDLFLKSCNRGLSRVGMCLVTSHKCIWIVLAKLELSTGTEWYNMLLKHPKSDGWWLNLQIVFIIFHHCDGLPFFKFLDFIQKILCL